MPKSEKMFVALLALAPACFSPKVDTDPQRGPDTDDSTGTGSETSSPSDATTQEMDTTVGGQESGDTGSGSADATDTEPGDTDTVGSPPEIVSFTVDGEGELTVTTSRPLALRAVVLDPDGDLSSVEFMRDGVLLGAASKGTEGFEFEWIVSGAASNGIGVLEVVATDLEGHSVTEGVNVEVSVPNGGLVETWSFDGGELSSAYAVAVDPDGTEVVVAGNNEVSGTSAFRVDRLEGPNWADTTAPQSRFASGVIWREGGYVVAGDLFESATERNTQLRVFDAAGNLSGSSVFDPSPNGELNYPLSMEADGAGDIYVLGSYLAPGFRSYLMKTTAALDPEWDRDLTGSAQTDGEVFAYGFAVRPDGAIVVVGSRPSGTPKGWIGMFDQGGTLQDQTTILDEYETSTLYDAAWTADGGFIVAGATDDGTGWRSLVRRYDADFNAVWTDDGPMNDSFALSVDVDAFGSLVHVSAETCGFNQAAGQFVDCRMVVRKESLDGNGIWEFVAANGAADFDGPLLFLPGFKADIVVDRVGYAYATAFHQLNVGGGETRREWWVQKLNP